MYQQQTSQIDRSCQAGVTLVELLAVISIVAILTAIGMPSYRYITTSYRISGEINGLLGDLQYARAEAVKEGQNVKVCVSTDGATCATTTTAWQSGWIVFAVPPGLNPPIVVLRQQSAFTGTDTFNDGTNASLTYDREGLAIGLLTAGGTTIPLHESTGTVAWTRCLQISNIGSPMVVQHTTTGANCT